jgi:1-acyl-sn-glycerol-3-phosphate acyltransferase
MTGATDHNRETAKWDPGFSEQVANVVRPLMKLWFRAEVRNVKRIPPAGGVMLVSNHSGGMVTPDPFVFVPAFYDAFGYHRPVYTLGHYGLLAFSGPLSTLLRRLGCIEANRENAFAALRSDAVLMVFPGGDYDSFRPTFSANTIDFDGRTGYVEAALEAGVPIVPIVSIGGQETQLFLTRGKSLARRLGLGARTRINILPLSIGFPFGLTPMLPSNLPLPSKIITEVLDPIDITGRFGEDPDIDEVDAYVRSVMQAALDRLASKRRFPVIG